MDEYTRKTNKYLDNIETLFIKQGQINLNNKPKVLTAPYKMARFLTSPVKLDYLLGGVFRGCANTYMAVFKKTQPDFKSRPQKSKKTLKFMLEKSRVKPHYL